MLEILYAGCPHLCLVISAQFTPEMCGTAKNCKEKQKSSLF